MIRKIEESSISINLDYPNDITIASLADLHLCESFNFLELDKIKNHILTMNSSYVCMPGDIFDSTNFLYSDNNVDNKFGYFLENIGKKRKVFITLGSHDYVKREKNKWKYDYNIGFWKAISKIENVDVMFNEELYEDDNIILNGIDPGFNYYHNKTKKESPEILCDILDEYSEIVEYNKDEKIKILLIHSPICLNDEMVKKHLKEYDLILCGHMHNGCVPPILNNVAKTNKGLIAPNKSWFPDIARNVTELDIDGKKIYVIINGGVTKIQECAPKTLRPLNNFFPISIDKININKSYSKGMKNKYTK